MNGKTCETMVQEDWAEYEPFLFPKQLEFSRNGQGTFGKCSSNFYRTGMGKGIYIISIFTIADSKFITARKNYITEGPLSSILPLVKPTSFVS